MIKKLIFLTFLIGSFISQAQQKKDSKQVIKVLIVDGFSNHDWQQTTKVTRHILGKAGLFEVFVSTAPSDFDNEKWAEWQPEFTDFDVVIQNTNNINRQEWRWPARVEKKLEDYVRNGGGLYILHSANNAFAHWEEYNRMIGLGWRKKEQGVALMIGEQQKVLQIAKGEGKNTFHGDRYDAVIKILNRHPIHKGFPNAWKTPNMELYKYARGPAENLTVLSYSYDPVTRKSWPVEWVVNYGKGRVYNSSLGHLWKGEVYPDSYRCIGYQTVLIRAVEWLARENVTYKVPAGFPTENTISLVDDSINTN